MITRQRVNLQEAVSCIRLRLTFSAGANTLVGFTNDKGDYIIKSYRTEIARATKDGIVWITTEYYSQTTSKHLSYVRRGFSGEDVVSSPSLEQAKTTTKWHDLELAVA
jgi:hypothetical protein